MLVSGVDSKLTHLYIYFFLCQIFSLIDYHKILSVVPCVVY